MRELVQALCSPITQVLILLGFAYFSYYLYGKYVKRLCTFAFLWLFLCSQYAFSALLLMPLEHHHSSYTLKDDALSHATQIYVLGGYYHSRSSLPEHARWSNATYQRLTNALFLHQYWQLPILYSGGNFLEDNTVNYTDSVTTFFTRRGVHLDKLYPVPIGTNTHEELIAVADKLVDQHTIIISSATHIRRLALEIDAFAPHIQVQYFPVEYLSSPEWNLTLNNPSPHSVVNVERALYEYAALLYAHLLHKLAE